MMFFIYSNSIVFWYTIGEADILMSEFLFRIKTSKVNKFLFSNGFGNELLLLSLKSVFVLNIGYL